MLLFSQLMTVMPACAQFTRSRITTIQSKRYYQFQNNAAWEVTDSLKEITPHITIGSYYDSKVVFWGRDFDEEQYGVAPYVMIHSGKGLYLYVINNYWSANQEKPARTDLGIGFETMLGRKVYTTVGYERWISNYGDEYFNNLLRHNIEFVIEIEGKWFDIDPSVYYMFGENYVIQSDIVLQKKYSFPFSKIGRVSLTPAFLSMFATRTFIPMYTELVSDQADYGKFRLVDYEASATISLEIQNLEIEATAHYNVPVGAQYEQLTPFYYFSLHASYGLYLTKKR